MAVTSFVGRLVRTVACPFRWQSAWTYGKLHLSTWIDEVDGITPGVRVEARAAATKPRRVLRSPTTRDRIVVSRAKPYEPGVSVVDASSIAEDLETRADIRKNLTPLIVLHAADHGS